MFYGVLTHHMVIPPVQTLNADYVFRKHNYVLNYLYDMNENLRMFIVEKIALERFAKIYASRRNL